jgi:hypothetical protein
MNKIGFSIQFFFLCCTISLSAQSTVSRIRVFPNLNYTHSAPVLSHDGNKLFFSVDKHPINVGLNKGKDVWVSEKTDQPGQWSKPFPISGDVNSAEDESAVAMLNQSDVLLVRRESDSLHWSFFDYNGRIWVASDIFPTPPFYPAAKWITYNNFKTVCFFGIGDSIEQQIFVSSLDSTFNWTTPKELKGFEKFNQVKDLTISLDNKTIFFSAEGDSSYGGFDIFTSKRTTEGWLNWSEPENIGLQINSLLDEYEPTLSVDSKKIMFTVKDRDGVTSIYQAILPDNLQAEPVFEIKTKGQIFSKNEFFDGEMKFYGFNRKKNELHFINNDPLSFGSKTFLPKWDDILLVSVKPEYFIPSVQLPVREGRNIYSGKFQRSSYLEEFDIEFVRLEKQLSDQNNLILDVQSEIDRLLQKVELSTSSIWANIKDLSDVDVKPIENELKILSNSYSLTLKLTTEKKPNLNVAFSEGIHRIEFWKNEYAAKTADEDEDTIQNFQLFVKDIINYQWYANQLEYVREVEREYKKEALEGLKKLLSMDDLALSQILMEEYLNKLVSTNQPSIFYSIPNDEVVKNLSWPVKKPLQLPFFNEVSLRLKPLIEREVTNRLKMPMIDLLSQQYYLQFLKEKKQLLLVNSREISHKMETLEMRNRGRNKEYVLNDTLIYQPLKIVRDTQVNVVAYPLYYTELIPLNVPFFPTDSIEPDAPGFFELQRIRQILSEYPGLGVELAVQAQDRGGVFLKESREVGEKRLGFINTFFEMSGIGADRRNIYLLQNAERMANNNLPIQVLIRFFYRS